MKTEESNLFIIDIENEAHNIAKKEFLKRTKEISDFAVEVFKSKFEIDENKLVPRQWNRLEEREIDEVYNKYKKEVSIYQLILIVPSYL